MSLEVRGGFDLGKIKRAPRQAAPDGLAAAMEHIRGIAASRTPVETGHLVGTAEVKVYAAQLEASLTYDGPYARYQHYELELKHETGQALFEESALVDGAHDAIRVFAEHVKRAM